MTIFLFGDKFKMKLRRDDKRLQNLGSEDDDSFKKELIEARKKQREAVDKYRAGLSPEKLKELKEKSRLRTKEWRKRQTKAQRKLEYAKKKERQKAKTPEELQIIKEKRAKWRKERIAKMTPDELAEYKRRKREVAERSYRKVGLLTRKEREAERWQFMTPEEREIELEKKRKYLKAWKEKNKNRVLTPEQKEAQRQKRKEYLDRVKRRKSGEQLPGIVPIEDRVEDAIEYREGFERGVKDSRVFAEFNCENKSDDYYQGYYDGYYSEVSKREREAYEKKIEGESPEKRERRLRLAREYMAKVTAEKKKKE